MNILLKKLKLQNKKEEQLNSLMVIYQSKGGGADE